MKCAPALGLISETYKDIWQQQAVIWASPNRIKQVWFGHRIMFVISTLTKHGSVAVLAAAQWLDVYGDRCVNIKVTHPHNDTFNVLMISKYACRVHHFRLMS